MLGLTEDTALIDAALAYAIEVYRELSGENGAPTLGTQNQTVTFIVAHPELAQAVKAWAARTDPDEARAVPPRRPPIDETYRRVAGFMRRIMERPVFQREDHD